MTADYGEISRKQITEICKDVLGAKPPRRHGSSRALIFDPKKIKQQENFYNLSLTVKVEEKENENGTDGTDGTLSEGVGLDKHLTKSSGAERESDTKDTHVDSQDPSQASQASQTTNKPKTKAETNRSTKGGSANKIDKGHEIQGYCQGIVRRPRNSNKRYSIFAETIRRLCKSNGVYNALSI